MAADGNPRYRGMLPFKAGLVGVMLIVLATYFAFSKANPFKDPYELKAVFRTANNISPKISPVRIAGVNVGKVKSVEPLDDGSGYALVTMRIEKRGLPIHKDAEAKIRSRLFLEGDPGCRSTK